MHMFKKLCRYLIAQVELIVQDFEFRLARKKLYITPNLLSLATSQAALEYQPYTSFIEFLESYTYIQVRISPV